MILLGIPTRGVTLAKRLAEKINEFAGIDVARGSLDITLYRDDLDFKPPRALEDTSIPAGGIDGALVIPWTTSCTRAVVRCAFDALRDIGRRRWCSWRFWSTVATVSFRSAPTTSARTCPRPVART